MLAAVTYEYSECPARVVDEIYIIIFSYDQTKWKIQRSYSEIMELNEKLLSLNNEKNRMEGSCSEDSPHQHPSLNKIDLCNSIEERRGFIEHYLNEVFTFYSSAIWNVDPLHRFMDDMPTPSVVNQLHMCALSKQVEFLQSKSLDYEFKLRTLEMNLNELKNYIRKISLNDFDLNFDADKRVDNINTRLQAPSSPHSSQPRSSFTSAEQSENNISPSPEVFVQTGDNLTEAPAANISPKNSSFEAVEKGNLSIELPLSSELDPFEPLAEDVIEDTPLPGSKYLLSELLPSNERTKYYDDAIDDVIQTLQPHETQFQYRDSIFNLMKKQIRLCLYSSTFEIGIAGLRCFLPDDTTRLTVIIGKTYMPNWFVSLSDMLTLLAERGIPQDDDDQNEFSLEDPKPVINHVVSTVNVVKHPTGKHHVNCLVDNMELEIVVNSRMDQCLMAFIEEVSVLVGQDNLFKRSLILIRAWWCYETASYVGCPIRHYLSDWTFCIMITAVFNLHYRRIISPFQALCLFLAEYSSYDGTTSAISLQGIVPFANPTSNIPILIAPKKGDLIPATLIDKYKKVFAANPEVLDEVPFGDLRESVSSSEGNGSNQEKNEGNTDVSEGERPSRFNNSSTPVEHVSSPVNPSADRANINSFERLGFSVVNPLNETNMIYEKLSQRRLMRLTKAFQIGAANLSVFLKQSVENLQNSFNLIKNYFPAVSARFIDDWRPDAVGTSILIHRYEFGKVVSNNSRDMMTASANNLWKEILYSNFLLENMLSESALLTVSIEILNSKGPLPVGEIGKVLAELTCIPNLSVKLKERFGGLKKFLEHYSDKFAISNDHPFNPHVMLRETLSAEHLELIDRGIFPNQLSMKTRKVTAAVKKGVANKKQPFAYPGDNSVTFGSKASGGYVPHPGAHGHNYSSQQTAVHGVGNTNANTLSQYGKFPRHSAPTANNQGRQMKPVYVTANISTPANLNVRPPYHTPQNTSAAMGHPTYSQQQQHHQHLHQQQQQQQQQQQGQGLVHKSLPQGHLNQYDGRGGGGGGAYLQPTQKAPTTSVSMPLGGLLGGKNQREDFMQSGFLSGSYDQSVVAPNGGRRGNPQQIDYMGDSLLGEQGHSNSFLSQLRDNSTELHAPDSYRNRSPGVMVNDLNNLGGSPPAFLPPYSAADKADYPSPKSFLPSGSNNGLMVKGLGSSSGEPSINFDSFFSVNAVGPAASTGLANPPGYPTYGGSLL